jgi:hypothetical protein
MGGWCGAGGIEFCHLANGMTSYQLDLVTIDEFDGVDDFSEAFSGFAGELRGNSRAFK